MIVLQTIEIIHIVGDIQAFLFGAAAGALASEAVKKLFKNVFGKLGGKSKDKDETDK